LIDLFWKSKVDDKLAARPRRFKCF